MTKLTKVMWLMWLIYTAACLKAKPKKRLWKMRKRLSKPILSIPLHKEVAPFLLRSQIKKANINLEDVIKALK